VRKDEEYPLFDGLGSERTVTNASQTVTGTINYDAFGQTVGTTGSSTNPYMFAATWGYRTDGDAGLMHVGARYYDAQVGRFITRDTLLSEHPYLYCEHEPVDHVDPDGHQATRPGPGGTKYRIDMNESPRPDMHIYYPDGTETNITDKGGWRRGTHRGNKLVPIPKHLRKLYRPIIKGFLKKVPFVGWVLIGYDLYHTWGDPNSTVIDYIGAIFL
jgi:RHS repeat-associated protein